MLNSKHPFLHYCLSAILVAGLAIGCNDDPVTPPDCTNCTIFETTTDPAGNVAVRIKDAGQGVGTRTLDKDTVYILDNFVFINDGQTLTIEAGTVIKGESGTGTNASALIVARGGKLMANGTAAEPIIFTSLIDDTNDASDVLPSVQGLWGGLILLGKATINDPAGNSAIEGIPTSETRGLYGGLDDADNSGSLRYLSIRHGGSDIGDGNEINGLTLGGVGSGTILENIEVYGNKDDGFEFFGGAANAKYLVAAHCGDDAFDWDQGYHGKLQYLFAMQSNAAGGHIFEANGVPNDATYDYNTNPIAMPTIANGTFIGNYNLDGGDNNVARLRQGSGGKFWNNVWYNCGQGLRVDAISSSEPIESETRLDNGTLEFKHNLFAKIKDKDTGNECSDINGVANESGSIKAKIAIELSDNYNVYSSDPGFTSATNGEFNLSPLAGGAIANLPPVNDPSIETSPQVGAFGSANWAAGWTALTDYGFFAQ